MWLQRQQRLFLTARLQTRRLVPAFDGAERLQLNVKQEFRAGFSLKIQISTHSTHTVCACVFLYMLCIEYKNMHFTSRVRTFLASGDILSGPDNYKGLFEG